MIYTLYNMCIQSFGMGSYPVFKPKPLWILYACFFSIAAACRVSTWTYLHIHLLLLAGQVEGSQHAISSSRPNHFVRFINLHRPIHWSVLLPSQIHEGPVADTNCVARWIATTKTFRFDDSQLVKCDKAPTFIAKNRKEPSELHPKSWFQEDSPTYFAGWWYTYPSEKYESQWEGLSHILWKIKNVPNHQAVCVCNPQHFSKKTWRILTRSARMQNLNHKSLQKHMQLRLAKVSISNKALV